VPVVGAPAIHPTRLSTDPATPSYTAQDVIAYFATANPSLAGTGALNTPLAALSVQFLPSDQVAAQVAGYRILVGSSAGALTCLVTLQRTFSHGSESRLTPKVAAPTFYRSAGRCRA